MKWQLKVLFFVEGFTDISFIVGPSGVCDLRLAVAVRPYAKKGIKGARQA